MTDRLLPYEKALRASVRAEERDRREGHDWRRGVKDRMPVMECSRCHRIWWPDRNRPRGKCK